MNLLNIHGAESKAWIMIANLTKEGNMILRNLISITTFQLTCISALITKYIMRGTYLTTCWNSPKLFYIRFIGVSQAFIYINKNQFPQMFVRASLKKRAPFWLIVFLCLWLSGQGLNEIKYLKISKNIDWFILILFT